MLEKKMSLFFYMKQDTFLHRLDPRAKIISLILLFTIAAATQFIYLHLILAAALLALFFASRSMEPLRRMAPLFLIIAFMTFALWIFFYEGKVKLFSAGPVVIYKGCFYFAFLSAVRFVNMLLSGLLYLSIASLEDLSDSLVLFGVPYRVAFTLSLSFRLVSVFASTGSSIVEAQKVRGNDPEKGGLIARIRSYAPLLIPLIINGVKKAETLTLALESKGFSPDNRINLEGKYSMNVYDIMVICVMFALATAAIAARFA
jgi:energy-coupling factor transport system permease protein